MEEKKFLPKPLEYYTYLSKGMHLLVSDDPLKPL